MHSGDRWRLGHRPGLDGLRGVAILLVLAAHAVDHWHSIAYGFAGVSVFFTLSGFLITSLLMQDRAATGRVRWGRFYARRIRRLLPALVLMVAVMGTFQTAAGLVGWSASIASVTYLANWAALILHTNLGFIGHTWSLAVEEQFYLLWPIVFALLARRVSLRILALVPLAGAVVSTALRFGLWDGADDTSWRRVSIGSDTRASEILIGCALALLIGSGWRPRVPLAIPTIAGLLLLVPMWTTTPYVTIVIVPTIAPLIAAALIIASLDRPGWLGAQWLAWWGSRSYGIYLWHLPLMYVVVWYTGSIPLTALAGVASLGVAELSWRYVEQPIMRYRR